MLQISGKIISPFGYFVNGLGCDWKCLSFTLLSLVNFIRFVTRCFTVNFRHHQESTVLNRFNMLMGWFIVCFVKTRLLFSVRILCFFLIFYIFNLRSIIKSFFAVVFFSSSSNHLCFDTLNCFSNFITFVYYPFKTGDGRVSGLGISGYV